MCALAGINLLGHQAYYSYIGKRDEQMIRYCWNISALSQLFFYVYIFSFGSSITVTGPAIKTDVMFLEVYRYCEKQK